MMSFSEPNLNLNKSVSRGRALKIDFNVLTYYLLQLVQFKRLHLLLFSSSFSQSLFTLGRQALVSTQYSKQSLRFYNTQTCVIILSLVRRVILSLVRRVGTCKRFRSAGLAIRFTDG